MSGNLKNIVSENTISGVIYGGIQLSTTSYNNITDNVVLGSGGWYGIWLQSSSKNIIAQNNVSGFSINGIRIEKAPAPPSYVSEPSMDNKIYHNNFMDKIPNVYLSDSINIWDDGYPSSGNYWGDYVGVDEKSGPNQDQPGSDGIGDTPYIIDANNIDRYPLMRPWAPKRIAFVVADPNFVDEYLISFTKPFYERLLNNGYSVTVVSHSEVGTFDFTPFNAAVITWDPSYITEPKDYSGLLSSHIGFVFMSADVEKVGLGSGAGFTSYGITINIVDNAHYITSPFSTGSLQVYSVEGYRNYMQKATDTTLLATIPKGDIIVVKGNRVYFGLIWAKELTLNGWILFDRSVEFAITASAPPTVPRFLTLPFKDVDIRIQQGWNYTWDAPGVSTHKGIDYIKGVIDEPETWQSFDVVAAADGLAIWSEGGGYGKFVLIQHNEKDLQGKHYYTLYAHLENVDIGDEFYHSYEERGQWNDDQWNTLISSPVRRGEVIGRAGATGVVDRWGKSQPTWIHLHFEVQRGGYTLGKTDPYDLYNIRDYYPGGSRYVSSGENHLWTADPPSFPFNCPPICNVKLQKDGIEINEINIGEFFDIYVGSSIDDTGIKQVRFSSDDVQDGTPTGRWTEWYEWDASSGDWDAYSKIKRWAFATPGYKEVWAEVKDDAGQTAQGHATIFVPYPALPVITSPIVITPAKDFYVVGDSVTGEFTIKNIGNVPIALDVLTVGGRLNGWSVVDFTHISVTLQPGESYLYRGYLTFSQRGSYHFFIAYYIQNPTIEEKKLLDENNWNTCVQLGEGLTHTDRVRNLIVFDEGTVPEEVTMLKEKIDELKRQRVNYPPYLRDPNSFLSAVAVVWADITSFVTRTHLTEMYDELYFTGIRYDCLRFNALINAEHLLEAGDIEGAKRYLQKSYLYDRLSAMSFSAAAEVFENNLEAAEILAKGVKEGCEAAVSLGVKIVYPPAAPIVDGMYTGMDFIITTKLEGIEQATKDLIAHVLTQELLKNVKFVSLEGDALVDYVNKVAEKVSLDTLLANKEFMEEFGHALRDAIIIKVVNELGISLTEMKIEEIVKDAVDYLESLINSIKAKAKSPIELRVINSEGQTSGLINKRVKHEIPMSLYYNGTVTLFLPAGSYFYEVAGTEEGLYTLEITSIKDGEVTTFIASDIPTSTNAIHQYAIDWVAISLGEEGVIVQVDSNGDGVFEHTFSSNSELTQSEYVIATDDTPPQTRHNIGEPKFVVNEVTYLTSATSIELIAEDNVGGSGVASTAYRIYNASYDSGWITYTEPFYLTGLSDGIYQIDYNSTDYAGNVESTNTVTVFLDNTPPTTALIIREPKYISDVTHVTSDTPFILEANDNAGAGVYSIAYRIYNGTYDSGWLPYTEPFYLTALADGVYTIEFNSTDNLGNIEATKTIQVTLFSWNYIFTDSYGRGTILKINLAHKFFQFITPDKDYGIRKATYMYAYKRAIIVFHKDSELNLATVSVDTQLDFCIAYAKNMQTGKIYWLIDKTGTE